MTTRKAAVGAADPDPDETTPAADPAAVAPAAPFPMLDDPTQVLGVDDRPIVYLDVPEWSLRLRLRGMSGTERDAYDAESAAIREAGGDVVANFRARMVASTARRADGSLVFKPADVVALGDRAAPGLMRAYKAAAPLSGLGDDDDEQAEADLKAAPSS